MTKYKSVEKITSLQAQYFNKAYTKEWEIDSKFTDASFVSKCSKTTKTSY